MVAGMIDIPAGRISGRALRALAAAIRTPARHVAVKITRAQFGIDALSSLPADKRGAIAANWQPVRARKEHARPSQKLGVPEYDGWPATIRELSQAFGRGQTTPGEVAEKSIRAAREFAARKPSLGPFLAYDEERVFRDASESAARIREGKPLSELDGIPIAVKEELHVEGFPTRVGTGWMPHTPAPADCVSIARLREAGAVIVGQTPMTEYGMSPLGGNVHRVMPRNPHNPRHLAGGSSTGSGVAVAEGVVPAAIGLDAGGSVRTPAAFTGVFGLKPTYGRIPAAGHGNPTGSSMIHIGPIGACAHDLAIVCETASGAHPADAPSLAQPEYVSDELTDGVGRGVRNLLIGIDEREWADASDEVTRPARDALAALEKEGAKLVPITLPLAKEAPAIGYLTFGLEQCAGLREAHTEHLDELGLDLQVMMTVIKDYPSSDYLDAQRLRATLRHETAMALRAVDVIALPTTAEAAPQITDDEARDGFMDVAALNAACRYAFLANLTGTPAGSAPVGTAPSGLPVGLQIVGDAWDEACVLQVLGHLERIECARALRPAPHVDLLRG